jgi:hypothetical protein
LANAINRGGTGAFAFGVFGCLVQMAIELMGVLEAKA